MCDCVPHAVLCVRFIFLFALCVIAQPQFSSFLHPLFMKLVMGIVFSRGDKQVPYQLGNAAQVCCCKIKTI